MSLVTDYIDLKAWIETKECILTMKRINITIDLNDSNDWEELIGRLKYALPVMPNGYHSVFNGSEVKAEIVEKFSELDAFPHPCEPLPIPVIQTVEEINGRMCYVIRSSYI